MRSRCAAFAAVTFFSCAPLPALPALPSQTLTLDEAFGRLIAHHPDLARFRYTRESTQAELDEALQRPGLSIEAQIENALGTGAAAGFDEAEMTLSLASVLERGGKREARKSVAEAQLRGLDVEEQARRLDLLAEAARRFLDAVAAQAMVQIAEVELAHREQTVQAADQRVRAGASPDSVRLSAEAARARARQQLNRSRSEVHASHQRLATLWNGRTLDFNQVAGDPLALPPVPSLDSLNALIEHSPELRRFADETRLREARVQLARSTRSVDVEWQAGVRRLQDSGDWAVVAGLSVPLGSRQRAEPRLRGAQAHLAALSLERESAQIALYATLNGAHGQLSAASADVEMARTEVLPKLTEAEGAAERAYRAGALSYLEWAQLQSEVTAAKREQIQAAIEAHRALIEIQRLTAQPFITESTASGSENQP